MPEHEADPAHSLRGRSAPPFSAKNQHGEQVSLELLRGSSILLVFFPYAFTGVCTGELTALTSRVPDFSDAGVRVLGCSTDTMYALRVFADTERLRFDLISDHWPHGAIAQRYGVFDGERGCARRGSFLLDADQVVRWSVVNPLREARDVEEALSAARSW